MPKVAAIQVSASDDIERNLKKAGQYLEAAARRGAAVACFPELFPYPWFPASPGSAQPWAETLDGALVTRVRGMAREYSIAVVCPFCERAPSGVSYNAAVLVDAGGELAGVYRKVHLPQIPNWEEKRLFAPGDLGFPVFDLGGLRVGVQLGWDTFFPEGFRCLALAGAEVVFVPSAAAFASRERWLAVAVGHAVVNGNYVVRVNRVGSENGLDFYGNSFGVRPDGELASEPIDLGEGILMVDCDPAAVGEARHIWPFLSDRRPREYAAVAGLRWPPEPLVYAPPENDGSGQGCGQDNGDGDDA